MIFKTINSSVDETKKTLALFNKDWNIYKRNWQNANGVFGKIGSVFTPANAITKSDIEAIKAYNSQIDSCVTSQTAFNRTMLNASPVAQNLVASCNGGKVSAQGMATAQNATKSSTIGLTIAQTALNATIGMGIGLLISLVVKGIDKLVHANEEAIEKAVELRRKYEEFKSTNESNISTLNGLKKEFEELSKGVSQYGDNVSLTTEQYERYKEIIQQIVGMSPSLAEGYSTENGYIADKNGLLERAIELQEKEYRNELRKITNLDNLKTSMSGYIAEYKEAFNGGLVTDDMTALSTTTATDFSNALYDVFNLGGSGKHNYDNTEKIARKIIESLGIEDVNSVIQKFINKNGNFESSWFFKAYADTIAENIDVIAGSLSADMVGLDDIVFDQNLEKVDSAAQSYLDMKDAISMANESIQKDLGYIAEYADGYSNLSTEQQKFVNEFLKGFNISDIMSESNNLFDQGWKFDEDKMASVKSQITKFIEALSHNEATKTALGDLYAIPTDKQSVVEYLAQFRNALEVIKAYCKENGIEIPISITNSEQTINELEAQYQRAVDFAKDKFSGYDPTVFFKEHSINTQEEIDVWQEIAQTARTAAEAEKEYLNQIETSVPALSIPNTITQLNTRLKPALDSLQSIYQDIFADDKFDLNNIDLLSACDSVKSKLDEMSEAGLNVDYSSYEKFVRVLQNSESTPQAVKDAFDSLASSITSAALSGTEDFGTMKAALETLGAADSETAALKALAGNKEALRQAGLNLADATDAQIAAFVNERISAENASQAIDLLRFHKELCALQDMNTAGEVANLKTLAENAGYTGEVIQYLTELEQIYQEVARGGLSSDDFGIKMTRAAKLQTLIQDAADKIAYEPPEKTNTDNGPGASFPSSAKEIQKEADTLADLNSQMDKLQSSYKSLCDIRDTYNKSGKITIDQYQELTDMGFNFLANLVDENGELGLNANAFEQLAGAKLQEMQIQMARNAIDTINGIQSETEATEYLTYANENLRSAALSSTEALLYQAQAAAQLRGEQQGLAADQIVQGYEAAKMLAGKAEFSFDASDMKETLLDAYNEQKKLLDHMKAMGEISNAQYHKQLMELAVKYFDGKEEYRDNLWEVQEQYHDYFESVKKTYSWIENLLDSLSKKTGALIDKAEKFISWQKKNSMINRAVKAAGSEITQNRNAYRYYMGKADSVGLGISYIRKIQNGTLSEEELSDEELSEKIERYQEWYDKAQDVQNTIQDLYEQQRSLIRQKLDNILTYYDDMDSYLSSITSKMESLISLHDEMGRRSSFTELVERFASLSDQKEPAATDQTASAAATGSSFGASQKVADAVKRDRQKLADSIQADIDNLAVNQSGTYTKLLHNIDITRTEIDRYISNGWDVKKAKQFDKLQAKLQNYYSLQAELDQYATSNTIANYSRIYTAYQKLQNKQNSGKALTKSEQKRYDSYSAQIDTLRQQGSSNLNKLYQELALADGSAPKQSDSDKIKAELDGVRTNLENSATYQNLINKIKETGEKIAVLDQEGYDNLTARQKKSYDKMQAQLQAYYAQKEALDNNATASNIVEYNKTYLAWKKLQDRLDSGKNLSADQWKKYNQYTKQLEDYAARKADLVSDLNDRYEESLNPGSKLEQIEKAYEESSEDIYDSYQNQINDIKNDVTSTQRYKNLLAKVQRLEQKKDTKGLSGSEQARLDQYNAELEALQAGGTSANISDYMRTWEAWYKLQQKLDKGQKLSDSQAKKYDAYKAMLDAWNNEKQTRINDLLSLMEDDLEQLQKTYTENVSNAESETNDYYANLYSLAKQIAEYNISSLQTQLDYLDACISYYQELASLYDSFSGEKLTKILTDLDENTITGQAELYEKYLDTLQDKYQASLSEMNEYKQLLDALDTNDFEASMDLFNKAMEGYRADGNTAMADRLQSVLDLLNERAADADNWDEYADQWANEWEAALASAKQQLIGTATEIQNVNNALREIRFANITDAIGELEKAGNLLSSMANLIQDDWLFDHGELSEYGRAKVALLVSQLEDAQSKANAYLNLYNEIQNQKDTYASDKEYENALTEALQNYYDSLGSAASLENSIMELMKRNSEEEQNTLRNVIEARKKALQAKKEYYDYDKSVKNSRKEIDSLKAQIDALENLTDATDAAAKAKLARLKAELAEKEDALQETKEEHTFNLQINALDEFTDSLTAALEDSGKSVEEILKNQKEVIESAKELCQTYGDCVNETLNKLAAFYGKTEGSSDVPAEPIPDRISPANVYVPQVASLTSQFPAPASERNETKSMVIQNHYESLIHVDGSVDKEFAKELPKLTRQICEYTKNNIYSERMRLK